jgi:hypothetical protein
MKQCFKIVVFVLFLSMFLDLGAQTFNGFSGKTETYPAELSLFFQTTPQKEDKKLGELYTANFAIFWSSGKVSESDKQSIVDLSMLMYKKKMRPFPQFQEYLDVVQVVYETKQSNQTFVSWQKTLTELINRSTSKPFSDFLAFSGLFFNDMTLYSSTSTTWKVKGGSFEFTYDSTALISFVNPITLICYANNDSSVIHNTTGYYYPTTNRWTGKGGSVNWIRAGFKPAELYVNLSDYYLDLRKREYDIDNVQLHYPAFFGAQTLNGKLEEKVLANRSGEDALYPKFVSTGERFQLKNLFKNVDYDGGITINGARLIGSGDEENPANVFLYRDGNLFMKFSSQSYIIRKEEITSNRATITIYWEGDSIYHPGIPVTYNDKIRQVKAVREREGLSRAPYYNTYHRLEMDFEAMYWNIDEPKIQFQMIMGPGSEGSATFTSTNYYSQFQFDKVRGIDETHPLIALRNCAQQMGSRIFTALDFAKYRKIQVEQIRNQLVMLAIQGYIYYDPEADKIFVKDKVYDFIAASSKKTDYDVIQFNSVITAESNATLSLINFDLKMRGVSRIFLSDSQMVQIFPFEQEILIKKNRDFNFAGRVRVGLFDYFGTDFSFEYDKFKINMPLIDSMSFRVKSRKPDEYGYYPFVKVKSSIEDMSGDLLIDHPSNKSGTKPFKEYPIFNSKKYSYVYYDKTSVYPGAYPRENFFYRIDPFQLDSMNELTTDGIEFIGYLSSAGIFPDIHQPLKVQEDYSLGFRYKTTPAGLPAYGGKGTYVGLIDLSNQGLRGDGTLNYLTSSSVSDKYIFFPEKTVSESVKSFTIAESKKATEFPATSCRNVKEDWYPYENRMIVTSKETPFEMYTEKALLSGSLTLTPQGLNGNGMMEFSNAIITSKNYKYKSRDFSTDTCDFRLKTYDLQEMAFITENYSGYINFDDRKGEFKSNGGSSKVNFPANDYICYMDQFDWYMDRDEIDLRNDADKMPDVSNLTIKELADIDLSGSEFISVHPAQDSLRFKSSRAKYSLREEIIYAYDVKIIRVADAAIIPGDGNVTILRKAEMLPLENAQILANTTTKYHIITGAKVNIYGQKSYNATGIYEYLDELESSQNIFLHSISVDSTLQTVAEGNIPDSIGFTLSPFFDYQGKVNLYANRELLTFTGGTRLKHDCDTLPRRWMRFSSEIDPINILIPVAQDLRDINGAKMYAGIYFSNDSIGVYSTIAGPKMQGGDIEVATAWGFLTFDRITSEYRISSKEKLSQLTLPGNYLSLSIYKCLTRAEGKLSLGANLGRVAMNFYGTVLYNAREDTTTINTVTELDFYFNEEATALLTQTLLSATGLEGIGLNSELYTKYLGEVMGIEEADKIITELSLYGQMKKIPDQLNHTITFVDLNLTYDKSTKSYVSVGSIGIGSIGTTQINRYVPGRMQLELKRGGDRLTFYLEVEPSVWFFFSYANGLMQAFSSEKAFNDFIINAKPESRQLSSKDGEKAYSYYISTARRKEAFLKKTSMEEED